MLPGPAVTAEPGAAADGEGSGSGGSWGVGGWGGASNKVSQDAVVFLV